MVKTKDEKTEIVSKEEKFWRDVKERSIDTIKAHKKEIEALKRMIEASDLMIKTKS